MDNVCHTLLGVAASRAGFHRTTRLATSTLAIASNLPDIDVLVFATDTPSVAFRRGWTHGVPAQIVLSIGFALVMWLIARRRADGPRSAHFGWLLALSFFGVESHVLLDYLNNYGVRLLMPLSGRWFYGDAVFIVDLWLWGMLGIGAALTRGRTRAARLGLAAAAIYIAAMLLSARAARAIVIERWEQATGAAPRSLMVGPVPLNPFRKAIIVDAGDHYVTGTFTWWPRDIAFDARKIPKNDTLPAVAAARRDHRVRGILVWARFPYWTLHELADGTEVTVADVRFPLVSFGRGGFSATTTVREQENRR